MSVRKTNSFAQLEGEGTAVRRNLPRLGKGGLGFLRSPIDSDQIGMQTFKHFSGNGVGGGNGIQRLGFGPLAHDQMAAIAAGGTFDAREFFTRVNSLGSGSTGR